MTQGEHDAAARALLALSPVATLIVERDGTIVELNAAAERLLARPDERLVGERLQERLSPLHHASLRTSLGLAVRGTNPPQACTVRLAGSAASWLQMDLGPVQVAGRACAVVVCQDVTAQRIAEESLSASEARFRALLDASEDAVALLDGPTLTLRRVNPAFVRMTRLSVEELVGRRVRLLFPDDQRWAVSATLRSALHDGAAGPLTVSLEGRAGVRRRVAMSVRSARVAGGLFCMISLRDQTEQWSSVRRRRALERQLWRVQRAEMLGAMAGSVADGMAEELGRIHRHVGAVLASEQQPEAELTLRAAMDATHRGEELVGRLQGLAAGAAPRPAEMWAHELVEEAAEGLVRAGAPAPAPRIEDADRNLRVAGDRAQVLAALVHLMTVGQHALSPGGQLVVTVAPVRVEPDASEGLPAGDYVRFVIGEVSGRMNLGQLSDAAMAGAGERLGGSGLKLGFATAQVSFGEHGGHVELASRPARIEAWLPRADTVSAPLGPARSVVVLEREAMVLQAAARLLTTEGFRVRVVGDFEDALEELADPPDVFLADLELLGERAKQLVAVVGSLEPRPRLIAMGAWTGPGVDAVLHKPFGSQALREALRETDAD